jgi:hypothetical protein
MMTKMNYLIIVFLIVCVAAIAELSIACQEDDSSLDINKKLEDLLNETGDANPAIRAKAGSVPP